MMIWVLPMMFVVQVLALVVATLEKPCDIGKIRHARTLMHVWLAAMVLAGVLK